MFTSPIGMGLLWNRSNSYWKENGENKMKDLLITVFFGIFGVHKFRERNYGQGILYLCTFGLFFVGWFIDVLKCIAAVIEGDSDSEPLPPALSLNDNDPLPVVIGSNILLSEGEVCHYYNKASYVKEKQVIAGYTGGHKGYSIRIMKGMSYRVGQSKSTPVKKTVNEMTPGLLTITNKRIVFTASKGSFDKSISKLSSMMPFERGIVFQFGSQTYPLATSESTYIKQIISRIML